jgi:nucleoside-diphosphate-sugar epimerase
LKTLLIIGGGGFLGGSFFDYATRYTFSKWYITKIIFLSKKGKKFKKIKTKNKSIEFTYIKKNIKKIKSLPYCDYIIYAANSSNNKENIDGLINFIKIIKKSPKKLKILFTSSGAVYGINNKFKKISENKKIILKKIDKLNGYKINYAKTKLLMEKKIISLSKLNHKISIARLFTFFGKRILKDKKFAITNLVHSARNNKRIKIYSNNNVFRSYMSSEDLVEWLLKILIAAGHKYQIFNVGSDKAISIKDLALNICSIVNKKLVFSKNITKTIDFYVPSIEKAKNKLNLKIKRDLNLFLKQACN